MCLPLIGLVEGGLWALLVWLLAKLCLPEALGALPCAAAFPWLVTGFLHLTVIWTSATRCLSARPRDEAEDLEGLALRRVCRHCDGGCWR